MEQAELKTLRILLRKFLKEEAKGQGKEELELEKYTLEELVGGIEEKIED